MIRISEQLASPSWHCNTYDKSHMKIDLFKVRKIGNFFGLQNCVKFVLLKVQPYIGYQNNQKFEHL